MLSLFAGIVGGILAAVLGSVITRAMHALKPWLATTIFAGSAALVLGACVALSGCSANAVRTQAITEAAIATANNAAVSIVTGADGLYNRARKDAVETACGHVTECADPDAAAEAVFVVERQWEPVRAVWRLARVAVEAWRARLATCQSQAATSDAGALCGAGLSELAGEAIAHLTDLRCALRGLGVDDPFPGEVNCESQVDDAGTEHE